MSTNYDTEKRSRAAKTGWAWRRSTPTPEQLAWRGMYALIRGADSKLARLYVCDQVAAVLHHYTAAHPGDTRLTDALVVARRYAEGTATDKERLKALRMLRPLWVALDDRPMHTYTPADNAAQAVGFALAKFLPYAIEWGSFWASRAAHAEHDRAAFFTQLRAGLEPIQAARVAQQ